MVEVVKYSDFMGKVSLVDEKTVNTLHDVIVKRINEKLDGMPYTAKSTYVTVDVNAPELHAIIAIIRGRIIDSIVKTFKEAGWSPSITFNYDEYRTTEHFIRFEQRIK